ncbi:MmyB family transcriptional regulator [Nonomuraea glycinis]|uniref:MmyB family transcriptional regulator n=1 Tax=Nonomuraea glycinis TaxID=2047744 RepID=UPI0033B38015
MNVPAHRRRASNWPASRCASPSRRCCAACRGLKLAVWPVIEQDREAVDAAVVSDLRRATGRFPQDARLAELIHDLSTGNRGFADLWATGTVAAHREDHKTIEHPSVGPVTVDCDVLTDGDSDLKIVVCTRNEDRVSWWRPIGYPAVTVRGSQEKTWGAFGSAVTRSHSVAVSP